MSELMLGNEAVARGLYEAGCRIVSSYPGTPSTEITETAATYEGIYAEWAPNEKVAYEVALGAAIGGARAFAGMKHVGLNVAADPLFTSAYTGINAGLVIAVADDQGMHSSQNEQDSRHYARAAKLPMLEPSDSMECKEFAKEAFEISEKYDTPVLLRLSTRISHSQSIVSFSEPKTMPLKDYEKSMAKYVMMPGPARGRHIEVERHLKELAEYSEKTPLNFVEDNGAKIGVITSGITYQYAKEALGDKANYLKLGFVHPLPAEKIKAFAAAVDKLYIIEELDDFIEGFCKKIGVECTGKELFSFMGEYSQAMIRKAILGGTTEFKEFPEGVPMRPPVMCPGCPHRGLFYTLNKLKLTVTGDIGCYTLGSLPPLSAMDTTICMGASISALHGFNKARGWEDKTVAVIGDSTFMHSGMTGLANIIYNEGASTVIIVDNSTTGMTGHQDNPTTGRTLKGDIVEKIDLESLCRGMGVKRVRVTDPNDLKGTEDIIKEETAAKEPSVIISRRPCALLKCVKHGAPLAIDQEKCKVCKACLKLGCPAISISEGVVSIDATLCVGCGVCQKLCKFDAIS